MPDSTITPLVPTESGNDSVENVLSHDYLQQAEAFSKQPPTVQRFVLAQARLLAEALAAPQPPSTLRFKLPDQVICQHAPEPIQPELREQLVGGLLERRTRTDPVAALRTRLSELDQHEHAAVAAAASLMRYATALALVKDLLPAGRSVSYAALPGEDIPTVPVVDAGAPDSAITAAADAIAEEGAADQRRGELLVPYVPAARRFFMPQWVAFDDDDRLLVNSVALAEAHVASMQRYLGVLHTAVSLAPYMVAAGIYQQRRYGMLGQLINQGRALARHYTREIVATIKRRAGAHDLNRGLSLSVPYFDDQSLQMKTCAFDVIPAGRIMFVPAFVVRAAREQQAKVAQDTRIDAATRSHLLRELQLLEAAFTEPASA